MRVLLVEDDANTAQSIDGLPGYDPTEELIDDEARALSSSGRAL